MAERATTGPETLTNRPALSKSPPVPPQGRMQASSGSKVTYHPLAPSPGASRDILVGRQQGGGKADNSRALPPAPQTTTKKAPPGPESAHSMAVEREQGLNGTHSSDQRCSATALARTFILSRCGITCAASTVPRLRPIDSTRIPSAVKSRKCDAFRDTYTNVKEIGCSLLLWEITNAPISRTFSDYEPYELNPDAPASEIIVPEWAREERGSLNWLAPVLCCSGGLISRRHRKDPRRKDRQ
ncbi:hypothetical protein NDU88_005159 [Pleurodeles waltl]|uniref:Uncharacterized protein n=1 Tax=Pleurodeles waltl TaxID=8319 RepID=A0AAV7RHQ5_PLEWA|nr:hypothetical protein NDU88_005159 [Pleurodeles waltl]